MRKVGKLLLFVGGVVLIVGAIMHVIEEISQGNNNLLNDRSYEIEEAISIMVDTGNYSEQDLEFIDQVSKSKFQFQDKKHSTGKKTITIIVDVSDETYELITTVAVTE